MLSAILASMTIVGDTICMSIQKGLINKSLLDAKNTADLLDLEALMIEQC